MNSKILVTLAVSSLVLASGAFAAEGAKAAKKEHAKGTHKGHVSHKSVGACEDRCDDLRKQLDDLNASYQERIGALEQEVADLQEDQHNHDTLLLDPERGSWQLGFDLWWADADGGDIGFASRFATTPAGPNFLSNALRSTAGDDTAWSASIGWQAKDDTNFRFKFSRFDSDNAYNAQSTTPGVTFSNPFTTFANGAGLQGVPGPFANQVDGSRNVDVDDYGFERDTRMFASKKFAMNFQWGVRGAKVDGTLTFVDNNASGAGTRQTAVRSSRFQGWGPSAGLSGRYYISDSFEIQGGVGGAALLGDTNFAQLLTLNTATNTAGSPTRTVVDVGNRTQDVKPVLDMSSKLVWHAGNHLDLHVGYQTTRYFNTIASDFGLDKQDKDLNLSGFRAGVLWNFD